MYIVNPVTKIFGKDIASIIYRYLFQINMHDVNLQYRKFLNTDAKFIRFAAPTKLFVILFNYRSPQVAWNIRISHHVYTNNGWMWNESNIAQKIIGKIAISFVSHLFKKLPMHYWLKIAKYQNGQMDGKC